MRKSLSKADRTYPVRELKRKFIGDWENSAVFCKTGYLKSFLTKCWMSTLHFLLKNRAYLSINAKLLKYYGRQIRKDVRFERTVHVSAEKLGISGVLDLVEVDTKTGCLKPVEYKRGKPKPDPMDEIQLCAQGLCLEEMTGQTVSEGALWYMQTRHRVPVVFSDDLRAQTLATIAAVRELLNSGQTPPPDYGKRCKACSLVEICQTELLGKRDRSVGDVEWLFGDESV